MQGITLLSKTLIKCILAMPCGLGKTFTVSAIAKEYDTVIILAPLKKLTADLLKNMGIFLGDEYGKILLSSDKNGTRYIDDINNKLSENVKNIIASTYDSVDVLIKIIKKLKNVIIVVDEFHNLSENNLKNKKDNMYKILNIGIRTIYMSATPKEIEHDVMYKFGWEKAISEKWICDFNPTIPTKEVIEDERLKQMIELCKDLREVNDELEPANDSINCKKFKKPKRFEDVIEKYIKKAYFLIRSLLYNENKKCIVYLTTVKKAKMFEKIVEGFMNLLNIEIKIYMITNRTSVGERENNVYSFRKNKMLSLILNVQILNEGIDIPECDSVFIAQPNKNKDNLIQRMCRCNRITGAKNVCNMYLWTSEKNVMNILQYIEKNTDEYTRNRINIYDPIKNAKTKCNKKNVNGIVKDELCDNNEPKIPVKNELDILPKNEVLKIEKKNIHIVFDENGNKWFSLKGLLKLLGYENPTASIHGIDTESQNLKKIKEFGVQFKKGSNMQPHSTMVNEKGLCDIMVRSNKPSAKMIIDKYKNMIAPQICEELMNILKNNDDK
jgi:superfamily II DNA or RNA helicase